MDRMLINKRSADANKENDLRQCLRIFVDGIGGQLATKCVKVTEDTAVIEVIDKIREYCHLDILPTYALYAKLKNGVVRQLKPDEKPLIVYTKEEVVKFLVIRIGDYTETLCMYFNGSGNKMTGKCIKVTQYTTVIEVIEMLKEYFHKIMMHDSKYEIYVTLMNGVMRRLEPDEKPLIVYSREEAVKFVVINIGTDTEVPIEVEISSDDEEGIVDAPEAVYDQATVPFDNEQNMGEAHEKANVYDNASESDEKPKGKRKLSLWSEALVKKPR